MEDMKKHEEFLGQADILAESLPFMRRYQGQVVVIKFGGNAMNDMAHFSSFAKNVMLLKQIGINPVIVHGGGPQINDMLDSLNIKPQFVDGLRVTDKATMDVVAMVLNLINKKIVAEINSLGGEAVGLCGVDGNLVRATPIDKKMGLAGKPEQVDPNIILGLHENTRIIPVLSPVSQELGSGELFNVNGDDFAGAIAMALGARRLVMMTDIEGVLDKDKKLIREMTLSEAQKLINSGVITGGMIPKLQTCINAINGGVRAVAIVDGRFDHSLLLELFTEEGHGTLIRK